MSNVVYRIDVIYNEKENLSKIKKILIKAFPNIEIVFHEKDISNDNQNSLKIEVILENDEVIYLVNKEKMTLEEIKNNYLLVPRIFLSNVDYNTYALKLGEIASKKYHERNKAFENYNKKFNRNFKVYNGIDDVYDSRTGAVILYDYEIMNNLSDKLMQLFLEKKDSSFIYSLPLDNGHILRGANNYYYFIGYVKRNEKINKNDVNIWYKNNLIFFKKVLEILKNYKIQNPVSVKLLLGVVDNIRNFVLLLLNTSIIMLSNMESLIYTVSDEENTCIKDYIDASMEYQKIIFQLCFDRNNLNKNIEDIISLIEKLIDISKITIEKVNKLDNNILLRKCFNINREIDHYFENYINCKEAIKKCNLDDKVNIIGLLYGGLELPLIIKFIEDQRKKFIINLVFQNNGDYLKRQGYDKSKVLKHLTEYGNVNRRIQTILMDDNLMSGVTMQLLYNQLLYDGFSNISNIIAVRYPNLNRIVQLKTNGYALNLDLIDEYIKGMLMETPYTKIFNDNFEEGFINKLNFYSIPSKTFLEAMYLNNSYFTDSEVDIFKK